MASLMHAMIGMANSTQASAIPLVTGSVDHSDSSACTYITFVILAACLIVSVLTSDRATPQILPSFTSSANAPNVASSGTF